MSTRLSMYPAAVTLQQNGFPAMRVFAGFTIAAFLLSATSASAQTGKIPEGFTPIFDGKTLKGWHFSKVNHHGTNGNSFVENGEIWLKQHPYGQGGLLLTDKKYHNFEFYVEVMEVGLQCSSHDRFCTQEIVCTHEIVALARPLG